MSDDQDKKDQEKGKKDFEDWMGDNYPHVPLPPSKPEKS